MTFDFDGLIPANIVLISSNEVLSNNWVNLFTNYIVQVSRFNIMLFIFIKEKKHLTSGITFDPRNINSWFQKAWLHFERSGVLFKTADLKKNHM